MLLTIEIRAKATKVVRLQTYTKENKAKTTNKTAE